LKYVFSDEEENGDGDRNLITCVHRYSCSKDILKAIVKLHPLPAVILEHRKLTALITKYIDVLPKYIRWNDRLGMDRYSRSTSSFSSWWAPFTLLLQTAWDLDANSIAHRPSGSQEP